MNTINELSTIKPTFKRLNINKRETARLAHQQYSFYAGVLNQTTRDIFQLTKNSSEQKMDFFDLLVNKYNQNNYYVKEQNKENPDFVKQIFNIIEKPETEHFRFARTFDGSLENLLRIFKASDNKLANINFAQKVYDEIFLYKKDVNTDIIPELLESSNSEEYVKNYPKYQSYLMLNSYNKNAVKELDQMIKNNTYNQKTYDTELNYQKYKQLFPFNETENFNARVLSENNSDSRKHLLSALSSRYNINEGLTYDGNDKELLEIYLTTTKNNIEIRKHIIETFIKISNSNKTETIAETPKDLNTLFKTLDNDKHARNFIFNINTISLQKYKLSDINNIFNNISTLKLDIFKDNANSIMGQCNSDSIVETLKNELENPFYETYFKKELRKSMIKYGYVKPEGMFSKLYKRIKNQVNIIRYKLANDKTTPTVTVKTDNLASTKKVENPAIDQPPPAKVNKKEEIIKNIYEVASKKLGTKTFDKQKESFGKNATKMRLKLLPEIFASIKETRETDKAVGKKRSSSSNKDALELFQLINGKNRKFVNYLLKKRNVDKTRMFEVKDIITMLKQANNKIQNEKKLNPEYNSRDERKYYNKLYEAKLQQYGKV